MRPYRRKHHSSWRTRKGNGVLNRVSQYLKPFLYCIRSMWKLDPPFPLTAKIICYHGVVCLWCKLRHTELKSSNRRSRMASDIRLLRSQIFITGMTWFLLFLPLCYFLVPPFAAVFLFNYFSERISLDSFLTRLGELCAEAAWPKKIPLIFKYIHKLTIISFLYDYYQIIKCLRAE